MNLQDYFDTSNTPPQSCNRLLLKPMISAPPQIVMNNLCLLQTEHAALGHTSNTNSLIFVLNFSLCLTELHSIIQFS